MTKARNIANIASDGSALSDGTINYTDVSGTPTLATVATSGAYADVTGTPTLAAVATTGAYADVTGTPAAALPLTGGTLSGAVTVVGSTNAATFKSASAMYQAQLKVIDTTTLAANTGGKISFMGVYNSGGGETEYGQIQGIKENATDGDFAGALAFYSRANAANPAERMRIDSAGRVTMPYQPAFNVGRSSSAQTISGNGVAIFNNDTGNKHNIGGNYNTSTGNFTAPVSGVYFFCSSILFQGLGNNTTMTDALEIQKNNSTIAIAFARNFFVQSVTGDGGYLGQGVSTTIYLAANDTARVFINRTSDLHPNGSITFFSGYLIG